MEFILPVSTIYLLIIGYLIVQMLTDLFNSNNEVIRKCTFGITILFLAYQIWELIPFLQNENGKSFTVGWHAFAYSLVIFFTIFAFVCWILRLIDRKL